MEFLYPGAEGGLELRGGVAGRGVEAEDLEGRGERVQYPPRAPLAAAVPTSVRRGGEGAAGRSSPRRRQRHAPYEGGRVAAPREGGRGGQRSGHHGGTSLSFRRHARAERAEVWRNSALVFVRATANSGTVSRRILRSLRISKFTASAARVAPPRGRPEHNPSRRSSPSQIHPLPHRRRQAPPGKARAASAAAGPSFSSLSRGPGGAEALGQGEAWGHGARGQQAVVGAARAVSRQRRARRAGVGDAQGAR